MPSAIVCGTIASSLVIIGWIVYDLITHDPTDIYWGT